MACQVRVIVSLSWNLYGDTALDFYMTFIHRPTTSCDMYSREMKCWQFRGMGAFTQRRVSLKGPLLWCAICLLRRKTCFRCRLQWNVTSMTVTLLLSIVSIGKWKTLKTSPFASTVLSNSKPEDVLVLDYKGNSIGWFSKMSLLIMLSGYCIIYLTFTMDLPRRNCSYCANTL